MLLPGPFPKGTKFGDKEGVLLSRTPTFVCRAWTVSGPRRFSAVDFARASPLSEAKFRRLVAALRAAA